MSGVKYWVQKGSFSLINRVLVFLFAFGSYLMLVRYLNKADFGIYSLYLVITTFVELGRNAFLQNSFTKFYLDDTRNQREVLTSSLILNLGWTTLGAVILFFGANVIGNAYSEPVLAEMLMAYGLFSFLQVPNTFLVYYLTANMKFKLVSVITNARNFFFFMAVVVAFLFIKGLSVYTIVLMNIGGFALGTLITVFFLGQIKEWKFALNWSLVKEMFHFGKYVLGTGLTSLMTRSIDQLMIGYYVSSQAVASYNIARRFLNIIDIPITSISQVAYPKMAKSIKSQDFKSELKRIYEKAAGYGLGAITPIVLLLLVFPEFFIILVAGEAYLDAVPVLRILLVLILLNPLAIQSGGVLEVCGKPKIVFRLLIVNTILNITLTYFFIQLEGEYGGMVGAALASFISRLIHLSFLSQFVLREIKFSFLKIFGNAFTLYGAVLSTVLSRIKGSQSQ